MSHWNHRVIRHKGIENGEEIFWYAVHEVHYDDEGQPCACTKDPIQIIQEDLDAIKWEIGKIQEALEKPHINYEFFEELEGAIDKE